MIETLTLSDNCVVFPGQSALDLVGEQGLAFLVRAGGKTILFDTGRGYSILHNAKILGVDWGKLDAVVLSHAHADHTGGLEAVLKIAGGANVYVHPDIFKAKYSIKKDKVREHGLPRTRAEYEQLGARFVERTDLYQLADGVWLLGPIERKKPSDDAGISTRFLKEGQEYVPDPFYDEQVLALETSRGLVLVLGCTHNGVENTISQVKQETGKKVCAILGGIHLCETDRKRVLGLAHWLDSEGVENLGCGHCTGLEAVVDLRCELSVDRVAFNFVGKRFSFK